MLWTAASPAHRVCATLFAFPAPASPTAFLLGEYVGQFQALGQFEQCHHVLGVGAATAIDPTKDRVAVGADAPGNLRPRQTRLFLESLEAFGEVVGRSVVVGALSRH